MGALLCRRRRDHGRAATGPPWRSLMCVGAPLRGCPVVSPPARAREGGHLRPPLRRQTALPEDTATSGACGRHGRRASGASAKPAAAQRQRGCEAHHQDGQKPTEPSCHGILPVLPDLFIVRVRRAQGMTQIRRRCRCLDCGYVRIDKNTPATCLTSLESVLYSHLEGGQCRQDGCVAGLVSGNGARLVVFLRIGRNA